MSLVFDMTNWIFSSLIIIIPVVLFCLLILWFVRKKIPHQSLKKSHDVVGFTFSIVGVLYSVLLGFTVINVQNRYNELRENIHTEALLLADLYRDAELFNDNGKNIIRVSLRKYIEYVIKEEWWLPVEVKIPIKTQTIMNEVWKSYYSLELKDEKMKLWYTESISKLNKFMNARLARQLSSWEHLGSMMWTLLISGGIITICFMFFFGLENLFCQMLITALLTGYLTFMLLFIYSLDIVFKGSEGLKPVALEQVYNLFELWDKDTIK